MEIINYANGANMTLPEDAQIVQGVSGNAVYLPAGAGTMPIAGNRNELTISLWRQWDGVVEADDYRGVFSTANIKAYFDQATDFLTIELAGVKTVTDIKDDQEQAHWCFLFSKNSFFKIYKNAELKAELTTGNYPVDFSEGFTLGGGRTHATFDEVRMYKTVVTEPEIRGLYRLVTKGTQVQQLENIVTEVTPKYLGVVKTVPDTRTAIITKGERLGAVDANPGDWVLSGKTIGGWKVGVCYRWTGAQWLNLQPEVNYAKEYQACLVHLFEIEELKQQTGHFGALFAKVLVAQKAMIDELLVNQAFIKNLVVRKLKIDTDDTTNQDFEAWFDETNGLKIRNKGEEIFRVDTNGDVFAKNAELQNGRFYGDVYCGVFSVFNKTVYIGTVFSLNKYWRACSIGEKYGNINVKINFSYFGKSYTRLVINHVNHVIEYNYKNFREINSSVKFINENNSTLHEIRSKYWALESYYGNPIYDATSEGDHKDAYAGEDINQLLTTNGYNSSRIGSNGCLLEPLTIQESGEKRVIQISDIFDKKPSTPNIIWVGEDRVLRLS